MPDHLSGFEGRHTPCDRPGCPHPAQHTPTIGPDTITGWATLCCHHTDELMVAAARTVPPDEAITGLITWATFHRQTCPHQPGNTTRTPTGPPTRE